VVWLDGEHDVASADVVAAALAKAIATDHAEVVVDLSGVEFLGAVTIHLLRHSRVLLRRQGRSMTLRFPSKCARRVLLLADLPFLDDPLPHGGGHGVRSAG
jgi:anti-anti-sigma factor